MKHKPINKSKDCNSNYLAKIFKISNIRKHDNADRLQIVTIDFNNVVTGMDAKVGDIYVYFPVESCLNENFLSFTNSFRDKELNQDKEKVGFFEKNGRVRAVKLRGEKSCGYIVPVTDVDNCFGVVLDDYIDQEFDSINNIIICKKYVVVRKQGNINDKSKTGKKPRISRVVNGQIHLHVDTDNLRKNAHKIKPGDFINISYKYHGTSFWVSNVLAKRKLNIIDKLLQYLGVKIKEEEYDIFYGSRRVVKNEYETQNTNDFYSGDLWEKIKDEVKDKVPKGFTLYGECVGFTSTGASIQKGYNYGCEQGTNRIRIYRITFTNRDGVVFNLSTTQMIEYCEHYDLPYVHQFYSGPARDLMHLINWGNKWTDIFIKFLEDNYTEKQCFICKNKVPEEGIVIRKEKMFDFETYKLKSFKFLELETKMLDAGVENIEDAQ